MNGTLLVLSALWLRRRAGTLWARRSLGSPGLQELLRDNVLNRNDFRKNRNQGECGTESEVVVGLQSEVA
jgi:hypothetical protein